MNKNNKNNPSVPVKSYPNSDTYKAQILSENKNKSRMSNEIFNKFICLDPYWVTGFADGKGYFHLRIRKNLKSKIGWSVELGFGMYYKSIILLDFTNSK